MFRLPNPEQRTRALSSHPRSTARATTDPTVTATRARAFRGLSQMGLTAFGCCSLAIAADGPGISNEDYTVADTGRILSIIDPGKAISSTALHRGYLFVPLSMDHGGGQGVGAFAFYDVSNPAQPVKVMDSRDDNARYHTEGGQHYVGDWAEMHHLSASEDLFLISERRNGSAGFVIFDTAPLYDNDPATKPGVVSRFSFSGVTNPSNYDGYSFAPCWQGGRYLFAPTGAQGLYIIDTKDPAAPVQLAHLSRAALGNVTQRGAFAIGNLLILSEADTQSQFKARILDISNPANPVQIGSFGGPFGYHGFVYGSSFYNAASPIMRYDFTDPGNVVATQLATPVMDRPEYGFGKDDHIFIGHYPGSMRWKLTGDTATFVSRVDSGLIDDHAFLNPLGNLVILCSDHNNNRKMMLGVPGPGKDTSPPRALFTSPSDGATQQHVLSRVGISFSDSVDPGSLSTATFEVRRLETGEVVPGTYSTMMTIVNFAPDEPLVADSTYDVILKAGGVKDQAGNAVPEDIRVTRFSTGSQLNAYTSAIQTTTPVPVGTTAQVGLNLTNPNGLSLEHSWNFGDGTPSTAFSSSLTASHVYATKGNFPISVRTRRVGQTYAPSVNGVQVVHGVIPTQRPVTQSTLVVDPDRAVLWNVNQDHASVSAVDPVALVRIGEIPVGNKPVALAIGSGQRLWVINKEDATLTAIDRATRTVTNTYSLPKGSSPHGLVVDVAAGHVYVSLEALGEIAKIRETDGAILARLPVGPWPRSLSLDSVRHRLWVSRFISPDEGGKLTPIDLATFTAGNVLPLAPVMTPDGLQNGRGIPNYLAAVTISPDYSQAFVPSKKDNIFRGTVRDGQPLTFEHSVRSMAANLDLENGVEDVARGMDFDNSDFATAAVYSPLGNMVFFTTSGSATVWAADAYNTSSNYTFDSGGLAPDGIAVSADGTRLYIHHLMDRSISIFRSTVACGAVCGTAPQIAKIQTTSGEALAADVLRGKQIFYDTSDPRLAQEGYMSCASCHLDGGQDGRVWDFTNLGEGFRNTIDLNGKGVGHGPAHWTGNFDETQDFEGQIRQFASGAGFLGDAAFHQGSRSQPLGEGKTGLSADLDALAAYVRSLTKSGVSPHRNPDGSLTANATFGRQIFQAENCASCHGGKAFTDSSSLSRHNVGTLTVSSGSRLGGTLDGLDTPTLRGLWNSEPYLHDGSAATLKDVLTGRDLSGRHGGLFHRSSVEIDQLVDYLRSIDDLEIEAPAPAGSPPAIVNQSALTNSVNTRLTVMLSAAGTAPFTWASLALPPGLEIDPASGTVTGVPSTVGSYTAKVGVRDAQGRSSTREFAWTINDPTGYRYVKMVSLSSQNGGSFSSMAEFNLLDANQVNLPRNGWTATASSQETSSENGVASRTIDGETGTFWHTAYSGSAGATPFPHELVIDLGQPRTFFGFRMLPRQSGDNGRIRNYRFYRSTDGVNWGAIVAQGTFSSSANEKIVMFTPAPNRPPVFAATQPVLAVAENSAVGTLVGKITVTDPNSGQTLGYDLGSGNLGGAFLINTTGEIRVAGPLNYETRPLYSLQVIATDNATPPMAVSAIFPIVITNVLESNEEIVKVRLAAPTGPYPGHGNPALIGFLSDPDRDGVSNAIEVLMGTDPAVPNAQPPVRPVLITNQGQPWMAYEYDLAEGSNLTLRCVGSTTLGGWQPLTQQPLKQPGSGPIRTWRVLDNGPLANSSARFIRLEVSP